MWSLNPVLLYLLFEVFLLVNSCIFCSQTALLEIPNSQLWGESSSGTSARRTSSCRRLRWGPLEVEDINLDLLVASCIHQPSRWTCGMVIGSMGIHGHVITEDWSSPLPLPCGDIQVGDATGQLRCKENDWSDSVTIYRHQLSGEVFSRTTPQVSLFFSFVFFCFVLAGSCDKKAGIPKCSSCRCTGSFPVSVGWGTCHSTPGRSPNAPRVQRRTWHCGLHVDQCAISHGIVDPREDHRIFHDICRVIPWCTCIESVYAPGCQRHVCVCETCVTYEELCFNTLGPADVLNAVHLVDEVVWE